MKYGFIGCGNMGGALAKALSCSTTDILLSDPSPNTRDLALELDCVVGDNETAAWECERLFLAVKPQMMEAVLRPLAPILRQKKPLLITIAAGLQMDTIESFAGTELPIIRIMPNTPVAVGKGMILYCCNSLVEQETLEDFLADMSPAGNLDRLDEHLIDAACCVSGCGPAFVYMFMEAMADGAVACGRPVQKALEYAANTLAGASQMYLSTGTHPGQLKDAVCSPGGSTIAGVNILEQRGFRGAVIDCVRAAYQRNKELG